MNDPTQFEVYQTDPFVRRAIAQWIRNSVITLAVLTTIWSILSFFLPPGWWHLVINIGAFLVTSLAGATIKTFLVKLGNPGWLAWIISAIIWAVAVLGVRSIELAILEAIF